MKIVVSYSGGKDSQATLIWAVKKYGAEKITAVYCDTNWESQLTYDHIDKTTKQLGVELVVVKSKKYDGMLDLAIKRKRFPSTKARFCTDELKSRPMIDWILEQKEHLIIIQGIRSAESFSRSKMKKECRFFKHYFEPYGIDKKGEPKFHNYKKKSVTKWCSKYDDSILRPVFDWTGQEVIDYILDNGQTPNELYYRGAKRVGCFPCIMTNKKELKAMIKLSPEWIERTTQAEIQASSSFFPPDYIPQKYCSQRDKNGKKYPSIQDVVNYLTESTIDMFEQEDETANSCMSFYHLCE